MLFVQPTASWCNIIHLKQIHTVGVIDFELIVFAFS